MDKLLTGLATTIIGMLIVFFGLVVLILCIMLMHKIVTSLSEKKAKPAPESVSVPAPEPEPEPAAESAEEDGSELIAVISAAIAAVCDNEQSGFVVRRVRRVSNSPANARLARSEQLYSRL